MMRPRDVRRFRRLMRYMERPAVLSLHGPPLSEEAKADIRAHFSDKVVPLRDPGESRVMTASEIYRAEVGEPFPVEGEPTRAYVNQDPE